MKKYIRVLAESFLCILLFLLLFHKISLLCVCFGKGLDNNRNARLFYELPENTVDVLFVGDSHVYHSFVPQLIFDSEGYTSAIVGTSNQSIVNSYWIVKEALNRQKPRILIIDVHSIEDTMRKKDNYLHFTSGILSIPDLSLNKYLCYKDLKNADYGISSTITVSDVMGFFQFRDDYERSEASLGGFMNLLFQPVKEFKTFGYYPATEVEYVEEFVAGREKNEDFVSTISYAYLNRIYDLCEENGMQLILTRNLYSSGTGDIRSYDTIFAWAAQRNVEVIDFFGLIDEIGFDQAADFCNQTHLNYSGAKKATGYLIDCLEKYGLTDHRQDKRYSLWSENTFDYGAIERELENNIRNADGSE